LLHRLKRRIDEPARQEVARLYQLLPKRANELWPTDVTYIGIPGYGSWYAVTGIDYSSRYLLALHFTPSDSAMEVSKARRSATAEAQRIHGPWRRPVFLVTDNPPSWSRWVGGLEKDQEPEALPPRKTLEKISARNPWQDTFMMADDRRPIGSPQPDGAAFQDYTQ